MMKIDTLRERLHQHRSKLTDQYSVATLAVFGSAARGDANQDSDVDLLAEFQRPVGLFHLIGTEQYLQKMLKGRKVDLVIRRSLIDELRPTILKEGVNVFEAEGVEVPSAAHAAGWRR